MSTQKIGPYTAPVQGGFTLANAGEVDIKPISDEEFSKREKERWERMDSIDWEKLEEERNQAIADKYKKENLSEVMAELFEIEGNTRTIYEECFCAAAGTTIYDLVEVSEYADEENPYYELAKAMHVAIKNAVDFLNQSKEKMGRLTDRLHELVNERATEAFNSQDVTEDEEPRELEYFKDQEHQLFLSLYSKSNSYNLSVKQFGDKLQLSGCDRDETYLTQGSTKNIREKKVDLTKDKELVFSEETTLKDLLESTCDIGVRAILINGIASLEKMPEEKRAQEIRLIKEDVFKTNEGIRERNKEIARASSRKKRKQNFIDKVKLNLIHSNLDYVKFITLTFDPKESGDIDIFDPRETNKALVNFTKQLNARLYANKQTKSKDEKTRRQENVLNKLKYSAVCEPHKSGQTHYHMIIYNQRYLDYDMLREIWPYGNVHDETIKASTDPDTGALSTYLAKTLSNYLGKNLAEQKANIDEAKWFGVKTVFHSQNLKEVTQSRLKQSPEFMGMLEMKAFNSPSKDSYTYLRLDIARMTQENVDIEYAQKLLRKYRHYEKKNRLDEMAPDEVMFIEEYSDNAFALEIDKDEYIELAKAYNAITFAPGTGPSLSSESRRSLNHTILDLFKLT